MFLVENYSDEMMLDRYSWYLSDIIANMDFVDSKKLYKLGNIALLLETNGITLEESAKLFLGTFKLIITTDYDLLKNKVNVSEDSLIMGLIDGTTIYIYVRGIEEFESYLTEPEHKYVIKTLYTVIKHELRHALDQYNSIPDDKKENMHDSDVERRARYSQMLPYLSEFVKKAFLRQRRGFSNFLDDAEFVANKIEELFKANDLVYPDDLYNKQINDANEYVANERNRIGQL